MRWSASVCSQTRACGWRIPEGDPTGIRKFNADLAKGSDGLLPPIGDLSELEIATVRCSHTNATLRIVNGAARALNADYADEAGRISSARIVERQPSFKEPLEKGLNFNVISAALVLKCPSLMRFMATSGNADHGTARQATTVQRAKRVWGFACKQKSLDTPEDWKVVERLAAIGMPQEFKPQIASYMVGFRRTRPRDDGGDDGRGR